MSHDTSLENERWLPVVGYEGLYEVSDHGRVRGLHRIVPYAVHREKRIQGRILKFSAKKSGHLNAYLWKGNKQNTCRVHRLVLEAFVGPCPEGMECCHNDGNPANNMVGNLRWDTTVGNMLDKAGHGTNHQLNKTHCPRGHNLEGANLVPSILKQGRRNCLSCERTRGYLKTRKLAGHIDSWTAGEFKKISDSYFRDISQTS